MDLQAFITESLKQIVNGVIDADNSLAEKDAAVNPRSVATNKTGEGPYGFLAIDNDGRDKYLRAVQSVEFDVVVTVREGEERKGGVGLHIGAIGVGAAAKRGSTNDSESRLRFVVPIMLPLSKHI